MSITSKETADLLRKVGERKLHVSLGVRGTEGITRIGFEASKGGKFIYNACLSIKKENIEGRFTSKHPQSCFSKAFEF